MRYYLVGLYLVLGLITTAQAQTQTYQLINGIKVEAVAVSSAQLTATGTVMQGIQFRAQSGTIPPKFYQRAVDFTKGTTAGSIKNFAKGNAFQIGLTLGILGIGWAMDELTGQIYSTSGSTPEPLGTTYWTCTTSCPNGVTANMAWSTVQLAAASMVGKTINAYSTTLPLNVVNGYTSCANGTNACTALMGYTSPGSGTPNNQQWGVGFNKGTLANPVNSNPVTAPTPATDEQIATQITPQLSENALKKLHTDPVTGAIQQPQEVLNKMTEVANQYARELNPQSVNATAPTAVAIPNLTELPATDSLPQSSSLELPDFCDWAETVCTWLDWTAETGDAPPNADFKFSDKITTVTPDAVSYSSGIGSGSCPSPASFAVLGTSLSYSYQPICDLAGVARIFVLLFAYLSSVYIVMGVRK